MLIHSNRGRGVSCHVKGICKKIRRACLALLSTPELSQIVQFRVVPLVGEPIVARLFFAALIVQDIQDGEPCVAGEVSSIEHLMASGVRFLAYHRAAEGNMPKDFAKNAVDGGPNAISENHDEGVLPWVSAFDIKKVAGNPLVLDGSPYAETHTLISTSQEVKIKNTEGNPPTLDSPLLRGDHLTYATVEDLKGGPYQSQELLTNFSQVVSREIPLVPKESAISWIVDMPFIAEGCEFDSAHVICDLGKVVVAWQSLSIDGSTLGKTGAYRSMHRVRNNPLPVVVVHLYLVKLLKEGKVLLEESDEILFDRLSKGVYAATFVLPIAQREVVERHLLNQDVESNQIAFARFNVEIFVLLVSAKDRGEMESLFWKAGVAQRLPEFEDSFGDVRRLVVEYEGDQIVLRAVSDVSRFINEDGKLSHQAAPSIIKMPRDTPRLRDSPPRVESYPFYTTSRSAESIVCEPEHKFVTIEANTCSTYREAA